MLIAEPSKALEETNHRQDESSHVLQAAEVVEPSKALEEANHRQDESSHVLQASEAINDVNETASTAPPPYDFKDRDIPDLEAQSEPSQMPSFGRIIAAILCCGCCCCGSPTTRIPRAAMAAEAEEAMPSDSTRNERESVEDTGNMKKQGPAES
ncbi:hypothetical protein C8J56DRAFT_187794 [Mycena floridula]|nr:hypothetical protein C8J56DRAFT_187794 [Mycena floridula]